MDILSYILSSIDIQNLKKSISDYDVTYDAKEQTFKWIKDGEVVKTFIISGGSNPNGTTISVRTENAAMAEVYGNKVLVKFTFSSTYGDGSPTGDGSLTVTIDNIKKIIGQPIEQGETVLDLTDYLKIGNHSVIIQVTDSKDNSDVSKMSIQIISLTVRSDYAQTTVNTKDLQYPFILSGTGSKILYAYLDDELFSKQTITTTGVISYLNIPMQTHGSHMLKIYAEADVNGKTIRSNELYTDLIFAEVNSTEPIISSNFVTKEIDQYNTISIPYVVYDPLNLKSSISLYANGELVSVLPNIDRTTHVWNYRTASYGPIELKITCGDVEKVFDLTINKLPIDIGRIPGMDFYFNAADGDNNAEDRDVWEYTNDSLEKTSIKFSDNFDWDNGGFMSDADGDPVFRIKSGTSITIPRKIFAEDARSTGKSIKFIFRATNCRTYDAQVLNCMSGKKGLNILAQSATLTSEQSSTLVQYAEDRYIELDFTIYKGTGFRYVIPYVAGIPSKVTLYPANDDFAQNNPSDIVIGSDDCDVDMYLIYGYNRQLNPKEILKNFIADGKNSKEIIDRYSRNNIYDDNGEIDLDKLPTTVRYTIFSAERLSTAKKDVVTASNVVHVDKIDPSKSFSSTDVQFKVQGTSSAAYGEAAFNYNFDYKNGFDMSMTGEHIDKFQLSENSIPVSYFCYKVNVASSENANNACNTKIYEKYCPYKTPQQQADPRVRGTVETVPDLLFFNDTSTNTRSFYAIANMCNDKKNYEVFGEDKEKYPNQACIEFNNNTSARCRWQSDNWDNWEDDFEFRYPSEPTEDDIANFRRVLSWVVSTNRKAATNELLSSLQLSEAAKWTNPKCIETRDTAAYRAAKFTNQFEDYFIKDSALYYYLYTERHSMVDNRAKNMFPATEDGKHWHFNVMYDTDTSDGNNNEGDLILPYGLEDTDTIGTKDVFNAADSVLWCNIRDLMHDDLAKMFIDRENAGAWSADMYCKEFEDYQDHYPEAIWIEDFQKKYLRPYETGGNTAYLSMAYGTKKEQRRWWETYQEPYMSSKYMGNTALNNVATLRTYTPTVWQGVEPNGDFTITPYSDLYVTIKWGSYTVSKRAKRGIPIKMPCPAGDGMNDTETYIYCSSLISDIGDLSALYVGYINLTSMTKLQNLIVGSSVSGYTNTNMEHLGLGNNPLLENINLENLPSLNESIDASKCDTLKTFKSFNTPLSGVNFSVGGKLETVQVNNPSIIEVKNQKHIKTYDVKSYDRLSTMVIEESPVDSLKIIKAASGLNRIRLTGISWVLDDTSILDKLATYHGINDNGDNTVNPVLSGEVYINQEMKRSDIIYYEDTFGGLTVTCNNVVEDLLVDADGNALLDSEMYYLGVNGGAYTSLHKYDLIDAMLKEMEEV